MRTDEAHDGIHGAKIVEISVRGGSDVVCPNLLIERVFQSLAMGERDDRIALPMHDQNRDIDIRDLGQCIKSIMNKHSCGQIPIVILGNIRHRGERRFEDQRETASFRRHLAGNPSAEGFAIEGNTVLLNTLFLQKRKCGARIGVQPVLTRLPLVSAKSPLPNNTHAIVHGDEALCIIETP